MSLKTYFHGFFKIICKKNVYSFLVSNLYFTSGTLLYELYANANEKLESILKF